MTTNSNGTWAIQSMTDATDEAEATAIFEAQRAQDGFLGGRILPASLSYLSGTKVLLGRFSWAVQAFFQDEPEAGGWLPDGMRRVFIPASLRPAMGLPE